MAKGQKTGGRKPAPAGAKRRHITLTDDELATVRELVKLIRAKSGFSVTLTQLPAEAHTQHEAKSA